jgi:hypothetical protein
MALCTFFAACAPYQVNHKFVGKADLSQAESFYVAHNPDDTTPLDVVIEKEINNLGFSGARGEKKDMPGDADVLVTYEFHWFWDITSYLLQFEIELRDPATGYPLARGESWRTSLARRSPEEMAKEILEPLLRPSKARE